MFLKRILAFLISNKQNDVLLKLVILLSILFFLVSTKSYKKEGFEQSQKFILKRNMDAYDAFYAPVYEHLYDLPKQSSLDLKQIISATEPNPDKSVFLDIGCRTGLMVNQLVNAGYNAYGIDKSDEIVKYATTKYSNAQIKCGDASNPLEFERATFTHILCMNFAVYDFKNKWTFFNNCKQWLIPHGYLVLHLVEPQKFDPIIPAGKPALLDDPQIYATERITDTAIDFGDFKYKSVYNFNHLKEGLVTHTETFTDVSSGNVRQNEYSLYMNETQTLLKLAEKCGFALKGQFNETKDKHQAIYILEKIA
jgi:SAM-dependent methyltransferase